MQHMHTTPINAHQLKNRVLIDAVCQVPNGGFPRTDLIEERSVDQIESNDVNSSSTAVACYRVGKLVRRSWNCLHGNRACLSLVHTGNNLFFAILQNLKLVLGKP